MVLLILINNQKNHRMKSKFEGLTAEQKHWAMQQVKKFKSLGVAIPYGIIKSEAIKIKTQNT